MNLLRIPRERLLLGGALACLGLLVVDRVVLTPALNAWRDRSDEIQRLRSDIAKGSGVVDQESRWLGWRDDLGRRLLPAAPGDAESQLLGRVDGWARSAGLTVNSLRPRWTESADHLPLLELQVAGAGSLNAVASFLYQLETSPLAVAVEQMELVPRNAEGTDIAVDLRLSGLCQGSAAKAKATP